MRKPSISTLSKAQWQALVEHVDGNNLCVEEKYLVKETLDFLNDLMEELKTSKVSINKLQKLFGFRSEQLKKLMQNQ